MTTALQNGVSGLLAQQVSMDTLGNNVANANTTAFKSSRAEFTDMLYQTIRPASATTPQRGGSNPSMLGAGVKVASLATNFSQGSLQTTGRNLDVAIEGNGFLPVTDGSSVFMTRNGALGVDSEGTLVQLATKMRVLAAPTSTGAVDPSRTIKLPVGQANVAQGTTKVNLAGNLDARVATGDSQGVTATVYDSLGAPRTIQLTLTRTATPGAWSVAGSSADGALTLGGTPEVTFDTNGKITSAPLNVNLALTNPSGAAPSQDFSLDLGTVTQFAQTNSLALSSQDGLPPGTLSSVTIRDNGDIAGVFSNGLTRVLGKLATATFANTEGMESVGDSLYRASANSGDAVYAEPGLAGHGVLRSGNLEGSNVDLAREFTNIIITQRSYQANSRVISTSDQMLQELMQVIR